jgi:translin
MLLKEILEEIQDDLKKRDKVREEIQKDMRKATRLSKQAIQVIHQDRFDDAKKLLTEAKTLFEKLREISKDHPYLLYSGSVGAAFEENVEANILLALIQEGKFPSPKDLDVPTTPYLMSLGDIVGELRRRALNLIRKGRVKRAERCLEWMEQIYSEIISLDDAYIIVNGLRRKGDVARRIIEITRGDITIEVRRKSLENSILKLENAIKKRNEE